MHPLTACLNEPIHWTTDRGAETPGHYGDPARELERLRDQAALVDLSHRGCVEISGEQRIEFLSGLITNQIRHVSPSRTIYAALLSPQGRFLWDFAILAQDDRLLLSVEPGQAPRLVQRLSMYLLRTKARIRDLGGERFELAIAGPEAQQRLSACFPDLELTEAPLGATSALADGVRLWRDPRHPACGWRLAGPVAGLAGHWRRLSETIPPAGFDAWEAHRIAQSLPRGGNELAPDETIPLEAGFLEMNGVDFTKGCYVGQETTARTHHRGTLKKRLFQLRFADAARVAAPGTPVLAGEDREAGRVGSASSLNGLGLAVLRLADVAAGKPLTAGGIAVTAQKPGWATWD